MHSLSVGELFEDIAFDKISGKAKGRLGVRTRALVFRATTIHIMVLQGLKWLLLTSPRFTIIQIST